MDNQSKIEAIKEYQLRTGETPSVLKAVIFYLERNQLEEAQYKIMLDADKFSHRKETLRFFDSLGLLGAEFQNRLNRLGRL